MKPIEFLLKHKELILETRSRLNNSVKQTWDALQDELPDLSRIMSFNTFKQYLTVFAEVVEAVEAEPRPANRKPDDQLKGVRVDDWNVVKSGGYYRAFKRIGGKLQGVYLGRNFNFETARAKVQAKEKEIGG